MLLQKSGQRAFQLARAVTVDQAHDTLIGEERFVEEALGALDRFVDRAADDVEIGCRTGTEALPRVGRSPSALRQIVALPSANQLDVHFARRPLVADDADVAEARAHALAANIEIG